MGEEKRGEERNARKRSSSPGVMVFQEGADCYVWQGSQLQEGRSKGCRRAEHGNCRTNIHFVLRIVRSV